MHNELPEGSAGLHMCGRERLGHPRSGRCTEFAQTVSGYICSLLHPSRLQAFSFSWWVRALYSEVGAGGSLVVVGLNAGRGWFIYVNNVIVIGGGSSGKLAMVSASVVQAQLGSKAPAWARILGLGLTRSSSQAVSAPVRSASFI